MQFPRHSLSTCISTMYGNMRSMHEHTNNMCECVILIWHYDAGALMIEFCVCARKPCKRKGVLLPL